MRVGERGAEPSCFCTLDIPLSQTTASELESFISVANGMLLGEAVLLCKLQLSCNFSFET